MELSFFGALKHLIRKEILLEFRNKSSLSAIILYVVSTVFIVYQVFNQIEDLTTWISTYWLIILFAATNASYNSFRNESGRQQLYYYQLINPIHLILSKIIYYVLLQLVISLVNLLFFSVLLGNPVYSVGQFILVQFLGVSGIASILTLMAAIASKTNNNLSLTAILGFPILLPILLSCIKASLLCGLGFEWSDISTYVTVLALMNVIVLVLSYALFPYIWRA